MTTVNPVTPAVTTVTQAQPAVAARRQRRAGWNTPWLLVPGLALVLVLATWMLFFRHGRAEAYAGPAAEVRREQLQVTIVERGSLESAENSDIVCRVKSGSKGGGNATTIKWVIDDGTEVGRGQKIVELDDSGSQEQLKSQLITLNTARSNWIQAEENCAIVESQNSSDIETAKGNLLLAELDVCKFAGMAAGEKILTRPTREALSAYLRGDFEKDLREELQKGTDKLNSEFLQTRNDIEGRIELALSDHSLQLDRLSWSNRMMKRGYLSRSQADSEKSKLQGYEISLQKVQGELDIYKKFTAVRSANDLWNKFKEAERALVRVQTQAKAKKAQADADRDGKRAIFQQEDARRLEIEDEIRKCLVLAPQDGMAVYYVPETGRFGIGSQQNIVAQGEPVKEGQKLIRIPNLSKMQVNVRIHEAMVSKIRGEVRRPTGFGERVRAAFCVGLSDPLGLAGYSYGLAEMRERGDFRDKEEEVVEPGQKARIQIDAYPGKVFQGHVRSVATVASQADFLSSDVRVYQAIVSIDGKVSELRPGMSAEVTILAEQVTTPVLVMPLQAVLGSVAMGEQRKCFVLDEANVPHERDIVVGTSNDRSVEVCQGLKEGERVVLSPKILLGDRTDLRPAASGARRDGFEGGPGDKKGMPPGGMPPGGFKGPPGGFKGPPPGALPSGGGAPPGG